MSQTTLTVICGCGGAFQMAGYEMWVKREFETWYAQHELCPFRLTENGCCDDHDDEEEPAPDEGPTVEVPDDARALVDA